MASSGERRAGKILVFVGVMFLVVGLFGGDAGAAGKGFGKGLGNNKAADAPGQAKKADQGGANAGVAAADSGTDQDCGEYCSTSDGTPSGNGNGGGNGNQPCAGCVGNADNKNPPGQFKDGQDPNNGYECDGNNGIAKGNPAHSGCKATTTTVPQQTTTTVPQQTTTTVPQQTTTTVAEQTTTTVAVGGTTTIPDEVAGVQFTRGTETARGLASTGAGFMRPFTLIGALMLLVGMALMIVKLGPSTARV